MQPPASPPLRPPAVNYALPRVLKDVPDVIALTSSTLSSSLIIVYFMAPWSVPLPSPSHSYKLTPRNQVRDM